MNTRDKISNFWDWFSLRQIDYHLLYVVDSELARQLREDLSRELHVYCPALSVGFGGTREAPDRLLITANGNKDYFPQVEHLIENAPKLDGWSFTAFKPPLNYNFTTRIDDITVNTEDLWFQPLARIDDRSFFGIKVFYKHYEEAEDKATLKKLLFEIVSLMSGEKAFALDINYIDFEQLPIDVENKKLQALVKIHEFLAWHKSLVRASVITRSLKCWPRDARLKRT